MTLIPLNHALLHCLVADEKIRTAKADVHVRAESILSHALERQHVRKHPAFVVAIEPQFVLARHSTIVSMSRAVKSTGRSVIGLTVTDFDAVTVVGVAPTS